MPESDILKINLIKLINNVNHPVNKLEKEFENILVRVPVGYDEWLTEYYGEYMPFITIPDMHNNVYTIY